MHARVTWSTQSIVILRCPVCASIWGRHAVSEKGRPWEESYVPDHFARALRARRETQALSLVRMLLRQTGEASVLDYGCGQGVFLRAAIDAGMDAIGCDLDLNVPHSVAPRHRVVALNAPWTVPDGSWDCVVMLDVLEHHARPWEFLRALHSKYVLIKVPSATGPAARIARLCASLGRPQLLEQLFLVGENFPHHWLATRAGIASLALESGFSVVSVCAITEVGYELGRRMRTRASGWRRPVAALVGASLGMLGPVWSDATVALLRRN